MKKTAIIFLSVLAFLISRKYTQATEKVTFGTYPQTEITGTALTNQITGASYDSTGKASVEGNTYYKLTWKYDTKGNKVQLSSPHYYKCEPITWKVMSSVNGESRLIAEKALDSYIYSGEDKSDYSVSSLKKWEEETFYQTAFSDKEKASFIMGSKPAVPAFAEIISVSYGFTSNADRICTATDYANAVSGNNNTSGVRYWIQSGYIDSDGSTISSAPGKGIYNTLLYTVPVIRIQSTAISTTQATAAPASTQTPATTATTAAVAEISSPVYVSVKNTGVKKQKIIWGKSGDAKSYEVYMSTSKTGTYKKIKTTTKSSCTITGLSIGKTYYYKVIAAKDSIQSRPSKIVKKKAGVPNKPRLTVTKSKKGLICRWTNLTGAKGIEIYDKINNTSYAKLYDGTLTSKTKKGCILHPSGASGKIYIKVRTYNKAGAKKYYSPFSRTVSVRL